jgi:hypothetical protein
MTMKKLLLLIAIIATFTGCASQVQRTRDVESQAAYFSGQGRQASEVIVSLSKDAQAQLADNLKFDQNKLSSTVQRALDAKGLLAKTPGNSLPKIEVVVTDVRVRSNFSAVMWGFLAGSDSLTGDVVVRDTSGKEVQRFTVSASYALGGIAGGQDETRLGWLYETFAKHTLEELTGSKQ